MCILFAHHINLRLISADLGAIDFCPELVSAQYLVKELIDWGHILHTYYC